MPDLPGGKLCCCCTNTCDYVKYLLNTTMFPATALKYSIEATLDWGGTWDYDAYGQIGSKTVLWYAHLGPVETRMAGPPPYKVGSTNADNQLALNHDLYPGCTGAVRGAEVISNQSYFLTQCDDYYFWYNRYSTCDSPASAVTTNTVTITNNHATDSIWVCFNDGTAREITAGNSYTWNDGYKWVDGQGDKNSIYNSAKNKFSVRGSSGSCGICCNWPYTYGDDFVLNYDTGTCTHCYNDVLNCDGKQYCFFIRLAYTYGKFTILVGFVLLEPSGSTGCLRKCNCSTLMEYERLDASKYKVFKYELTVTGSSPSVCDLQHNEPTYISTAGTLTVPWTVTTSGTTMTLTHVDL